MNSRLTVDRDHAERIKTELRQTGISHYGLRRFTSHYLPQMIHPSEHVRAAVFGRQREIEGISGFVECLLIATERRIIYLDHRSDYTTMDEIGFNAVLGANVATAGQHANLTLTTKFINYQLSFAKPACARQFAAYIDERLLPYSEERTSTQHKLVVSEAGMEFLQRHEIGVLSSIDRTGNVSGSVIYYTMIDQQLYFITKSHTQKATNLLGNQHVSLTVFDEAKSQTAQLQGVAEQEMDTVLAATVAEAIMKQRRHDNSDRLPVGQLDGEFMTFRIVPTKFFYADYGEK